MSIIINPYLPFSKFTDKIQLFQDYLKWKEFFIFKCFLPGKRKKGREVAVKVKTRSMRWKLWNLKAHFYYITISNTLTNCVPTLSAKEIIRRLCFVLGPFRVFSAKTKAESTSRRCSLYFLSEITLFLKRKEDILALLLRQLTKDSKENLLNNLFHDSL